VAQETQPRLFARALAEETGVGVGGRGVRLILPALAVEVAFGVAPRARRLARGILYAKLFGLADASNSVPSTAK
jgi:hypothetical protein